MKKSLFILLASVATLIASCSKDAKINRRIDGEWKVVSIAGVPTSADESYTWKFSKDKRFTGDGTLSVVYSTGTETTPFTYSVSSKKILLIADGECVSFAVNKYERKKIELIDPDSQVWVLEPK
jgi:hypothetical protein